MTAVYVDVDDLKKTLQATGTTFLDDDLDSAAISASRGIDEVLRRTFGQEEQTRYYSPVHPYHLRIDDLVEITTLKTDEDGDRTYETTWATTDYYLEPLNAAADAKPYMDICVDRGNGTKRFPYLYARGVEIVGVFGWPSVPQQIVDAAGVIATKLVKRKRDAPFGFVVINSESAAYIARYDPEVAFLLKGLERRSLQA